MSEITTNLASTMLDYGILGIAVVLLGGLAYKRLKDLEVQVKILSQIVVLQNSAIAEIKGFVIASDKFETKEKDHFLQIVEDSNKKISELHAMKS